MNEEGTPRCHKHRMIISIMVLSSLHRRGFLTLSLLLSARSVAPGTAEAASGRPGFPNLSRWNFGTGARARAKIPDKGANNGECSSEGDSREVCPASAPGKKVPTGRSRLARQHWTERLAEDRALDDCLQRNCPSCLEVRGGHLHQPAAEAAGAAAAAISSSGTIPLGLPLNVWKVIFQVALTTLNVVCWLVPLNSERISSNKLGLSLANAFSGGVFLSLAFGHLIPECVHGFGPEYNEALPYMIVLGGYLLIFFVEKVAFDAHGLMHGAEEGSDAHGHNAHGHKQGEKAAQNGGSNADENGGLKSGRSAVILLGALAVHSILEMTALGLANTFGESALLSLSIALHQVSSNQLKSGAMAFQ